MNRKNTAFFRGVTTLSTTLLLSSISIAVEAATFRMEPLFSNVQQYSTDIDGDPTDIYYPIVSDPSTSTPVALLFQGAFVDQADYSIYASTVASYGFTVVVPNNLRTVALPGENSFTGLIAEQGQVRSVLDFMTLENANPGSPVAGLLDTNSLGLLGHSLGGAVGIASVQDNCFIVLCADSYSFPEEVKAGIFYATGFDFIEVGLPGVPPINNQAPIGLISGTRDSVIPLGSSVETYNNILNPPKLFVEIDGANHYGITNEDNPLREPVRPTLEQEIATETIARWSAAFLSAYVLNDPEALAYISFFGDQQDPNVTVTDVSKIPESSPAFGVFAVSLFFLYRRLHQSKS